MRMNRKAGTTLVAALILMLHSAGLCAAGVPNCTWFSVCSGHHQEQGCHGHQHHDSRKSEGCVCCQSLLCAPRAEINRPDGGSSSDRVAAFVPVWIATLPLNPAFIGGSLLRVSESPPPLSPVSLFLTHKALLL